MKLKTIFLSLLLVSSNLWAECPVGWEGYYNYITDVEPASYEITIFEKNGICQAELDVSGYGGVYDSILADVKGNEKEISITFNDVGNLKDKEDEELAERHKQRAKFYKEHYKKGLLLLKLEKIKNKLITNWINYTTDAGEDVGDDYFKFTPFVMEIKIGEVIKEKGTYLTFTALEDLTLNRKKLALNEETYEMDTKETTETKQLKKGETYSFYLLPAGDMPQFALCAKIENLNELCWKEETFTGKEGGEFPAQKGFFIRK